MATCAPGVLVGFGTSQHLSVCMHVTRITINVWVSSLNCVQVGLILVLDGLVFAYEQYQYMQGKVPFQ